MALAWLGCSGSSSGLRATEEWWPGSRADDLRLAAFSSVDAHSADSAAGAAWQGTSLLDGLSGPTTRARIWRGLTQEDAVSRTLHEHRAILGALRDRDAEAARSWATVHIASVEQWLASVL